MLSRGGYLGPGPGNYLATCEIEPASDATDEEVDSFFDQVKAS